MIFNLNANFLSLCSGLVVSGYSKSQIDQLLLTTWKTKLANSMEHYKKYKKMYIVDAADEFKGIKC